VDLIRAQVAPIWLGPLTLWKACRKFSQAELGVPMRRRSTLLQNNALSGNNFKSLYSAIPNQK
ncbi:hypothetical protein, partial [Sporolactobacillus vineae]|uniref:hypothetical protein n=1 Tax=Sporolactobacillus vineae TaxID=444463 RepID=UPI001EE68401